MTILRDALEVAEQNGAKLPTPVREALLAYDEALNTIRQTEATVVALNHEYQDAQQVLREATADLEKAVRDAKE